MRKGLRRIEHIICTILTLTAVLICGCVQKEEFIKNISVTIADSLFFTPSVSATRVKAGDDLTVTLEMLHGYEFVSCDYENYSVMPVGLGAVKLTLHDICVPSRVTVTTQLRQTDNSREEINCSVSYNLNGGDYEGKSELTYNYTLTEHLRPNTWNGQGIKKDGYTLIGWNTQSDGNGEHIGLGSRVTVGDEENITLYAEWVKWLPEEDFLYRTHPDGTAAVTGYRGDGNEEMFVIPAEIDGYAINEIAGSLTTNIPCGKIISPILVLPDTITSISGGAFTNSAFREIYFFDNIEFIADNSFPYNITTYHINAALAPRYQAVNNSTYYADCVDRLITTGDKKRIIFFAGCSTAYGINSPMVQAAAGEDYAVCNLGVNGDINGAFQLEVILHYISEGDILVHTPEVMSAPQLMSSFYLDGRAFIMCEGNYDLLSIPDFSESDLIFRAYMHYVTIRNNEQECSYTDGRSEDFNIYGDYIYPRPYVEENESERDVSYSANAYNFTPEMLTEDGIEKLTSYYDDAVAKGAKVCISYSPTNGSSQTDVPVEEAAEAFDKRFRTLLSSFGYSLISDYRDYIFEGRYFYDSDYHLNELGAILRTGQLLEDLQASGIIELGI